MAKRKFFTVTLGFWIWRYAFQLGSLLYDVTVAQYYMAPEEAYYPRYTALSRPVLIHNQPVVRYPVQVVREIIVVPNLRFLPPNNERRMHFSFARTRTRRPTGKSLPERRQRTRRRYYKRRTRSYYKKLRPVIKDESFSVYNGFYIARGSPLRGKFASGADCKEACATRSSCFAADYQETTRKCYLHTLSTACDAISTKQSYIHYQKAGCETIIDHNDGMEVFPHKYVSGGDKLSQNVTLSGCIENCVNRNTEYVTKCFGIDYDYERHTCYLHANRSLVCPPPDPNKLEERPNTVHMVSCS